MHRHKKSVQLLRVHLTAVILLHIASYQSIQKTTVFISPTYQVYHNYLMLWACPTYFPLFFFFSLFKFGIPLQQWSLLCSNNNIPHKRTGFQPSNLTTKDQRIASRLSQMRTTVSWTLYTTNAPIKLCTMGMNVYLSLYELLLYKGKSLKRIYISLNKTGKETLSKEKIVTLIWVLYLRSSSTPSFL